MRTLGVIFPVITACSALSVYNIVAYALQIRVASRAVDPIPVSHYIAAASCLGTYVTVGTTIAAANRYGTVYLDTLNLGSLIEMPDQTSALQEDNGSRGTFVLISLRLRISMIMGQIASCSNNPKKMNRSCSAPRFRPCHSLYALGLEIRCQNIDPAKSFANNVQTSQIWEQKMQMNV